MAWADGLYSCNNGIDTTAIDQVQEEVEYLNDYVASLLEKDKSSQKDTNTIDTNANAESLSQSKTQKTNIQNNPYFLCGDFTQLDSFGFQQQFDCISLVLPCILSAKLNKMKPWQIALNIVKMAEFSH